MRVWVEQGWSGVGVGGAGGWALGGSLHILFIFMKVQNSQ